jgi:3-dehydroquinate dehydratase
MIKPINERICISVSENNEALITGNLSMWTGFIFELRIDMFGGKKLPTGLLQSGNRIIVTCRGRDCSLQEKRRWAEASSNLLAIDIEYGTNDFRKELDIFRSFPVLISYHDYKSTPQFDELTSKVSEMFNLNANFIKVVTSGCTESCKVLMELYEKFPATRLIAFTMGTSSLNCRVEALKNGAPFVYAAPGINQGVFDGQPFYKDIIELFKK